MLVKGDFVLVTEGIEGLQLAKEVQAKIGARPVRKKTTPAYLEDYERSHAEWGA